MKEKERKIDVRMLYILPSLLALVMAFAPLAFQFGNEVVDLKNTCYTIYISIPEGHTDETMIGELNELLIHYDITGYTIVENDQGATIINNELSLDHSLQIILLQIPKKTAYTIAHDLSDHFHNQVLLEQTIVKAELI